MGTKYAILVNEDTLDLIAFLNNGVRPKIVDDKYFVFKITKAGCIASRKNQVGDQLYNAEGYSHDPNLVFVIG